MRESYESGETEVIREGRNTVIETRMPGEIHHHYHKEGEDEPMATEIIDAGGGMGGAGAGLGAGLGGGLLGGILASALFGNGFGNRNGVAASEVTSAVDTTAILGAINNSSVMNLQGQNGTNLTVERAAASSFTGLTAQNTQNLLASVQGFAGLNTVIMNGTNATVAAIGAADRAQLERSFAAQLAAEKCCCETNLNIERQGNETRGLIRDQFAASQAVLICDLKAQATADEFKISQLKQTAELTANFNAHINAVYQLINFKLPTPPTPPVA